MLQTVYRSDRVCSLEHVAAAHEHVGTSSHEQRSRLVVYAAVYLYERLAARLVDEAAQALRLLTSSLKKHTFYNLLINNILYLCVT